MTEEEKDAYFNKIISINDQINSLKQKRYKIADEDQWKIDESILNLKDKIRIIEMKMQKEGLMDQLDEILLSDESTDN